MESAPTIHPPAVQRFRSWVERCGSQREARQRLTAHGVVVSQQTVSRWCSGVDRPDPELRAGIAEATRNFVRVWMWLTPAESAGLRLPRLPSTPAAA